MREVPHSYLEGYNKAISDVKDRAKTELIASLRLIDYTADPATVRDGVLGIMDAICEGASQVAAMESAIFYDGLRERVVGEAMGTNAGQYRDATATNKSVRAFLKKLFEGDYDEFEALCAERLDYEINVAAGRAMVANVRDDPDRPRFARVPQGERTCDFCLMLASRGPVYLTEESAGAFTQYHAHCDCKIVPFWNTYAVRTKAGGIVRRSGTTSYEGYDPDYYYDVYRGMQDRFIPPAKISNYCLLDPDKSKGFKECLGYERGDADRLTMDLYAASSRSDMVYRDTNQYGDRYYQVVVMEGLNGKTAKVLIGWIDRKNGDKMQLTTAHIDD